MSKVFRFDNFFVKETGILIKKLFRKKIVLGIIFSVLLLGNLNAQSENPLNATDVNAFDRLIMNPYSKGLDYTGTAFELLTLSTPAVMFAAPVKDYWKIGLEYAETIALAWGSKEIAKLCVSRPRPYMYFDGAPAEKIAAGDWDDSFFSGHSTLSFAAATFTTYKFCEYFPDSKYTPFVIVGSYALAATTACLRLASGNHFMTDVLCGAAVGSAIGFLVPWVNSFWFKPSVTKENEGELKKSDFAVNLLPNGFVITCNL